MKTKDLIKKVTFVSEAKELINELYAFIEEKENLKISKNEILLRKEVSNLLDGVGEGFISEDYYAKDRFLF